MKFSDLCERCKVSVAGQGCPYKGLKESGLKDECLGRLKYECPGGKCVDCWDKYATKEDLMKEHKFDIENHDIDERTYCKECERKLLNIPITADEVRRWYY